MGRRKDPKQLFKIMTYVLGHRPDEFGLSPDEDGFIRIKDLLRAICEEPGWGYVRKSHINEVLITMRDNPFVLEKERIKVENPDDGAKLAPNVVPPKLLYHCVRRKAYPVVCKKGVMSMGQNRIILATTEGLAQRIGKRRDPKPVLLTVQAQRAFKAGETFFRQGKVIYLTDRIPVGYFTGPPLPKEKEEETKRRKEPLITPEHTPGSFVLDMDRSDGLHRQQIKRKGIKKSVPWKKEARKFRRKQRKG